MKSRLPHRQRHISVVVFCGLLLLIALGVLSSNSNSLGQLSDQGTTTEKQENNLSSSPTPGPFAELTIPYLRNQSYQSQLGEQTIYEQKPSYTSYLTSYTSEGLKINGLLTIPKGKPPEGGWPAVVFIHGYIPPDQYQTTAKYVEYVDYLARNNLVVFKIDLRGHGDSEGEANGAYYSSDYIVDTLNAYAALESADFVNPAKIGLWGHSMAGNVVFRTLAIKPNIPAAVIWAGAVYSYTDWQQYGLSDHSFQLNQQRRSDRENRRQALFTTHGQFSAENPFWQQVAATNYLSDLQTTLQFHHAVNDTVVNIGYSRDLTKLLESTNITHELFEYATGGHNISGSSFSQAMRRTVEFFQTNLNS